MRALEAFVARCQVLSADAETASIYATTRAALKTAGTPIPENDVWIAAICIQHRVPLATLDGHFKSVHGLTLIS